MQHPLKLKLLTLLLCSATLAGCMGNRLGTAQRLATQAGLSQRQITAGPFQLTVFERLSGPPGSPATAYIEGDGLAFIANSPTLDPTPTNPVGLRLAGADRGANVIWLARPCQYSKLTSADPCPMDYWTGKRFAPEVIAAMDAALDSLGRRHGINGLHLVGYSGGAGLAVLLAARRRDVLSLRTVAGNLDNAALTRLHEVDAMPDSLDPADSAVAIAALPQHHFIGADDKIAPLAIFQSYQSRAGASPCIRHTVVADIGHQGDWAALWPSLLQAPLGCGQRTDDR